MAKYLLVYHGGDHPETEAEVAKVMDDWGQWFGSIGCSGSGWRQPGQLVQHDRPGRLGQ